MDVIPIKQNDPSSLKIKMLERAGREGVSHLTIAFHLLKFPSSLSIAALTPLLTSL